MKKEVVTRVILDEEDIKQFHSDAKHLAWIFGRMTEVHKENPNLEYMARFSSIIDKLKNM